MHLSSVIRGFRGGTARQSVTDAARPRGFRPCSNSARRTLTALLCAVGVLAAGCHNNTNASGYGIAWVTLTDSPGDFTSYIVNIDSITLTRSDGAVVTALATPETVDFTKLNNIAELWGTATIPVGTYTSASIILDYYTSPNISVMVNGLPTAAKILDSTGAVIAATLTVNVLLDPANPLVVVPTYATTAAQRLTIDLNLAASTEQIDTSQSPPIVQVRPYMTVAVSPADNKPIRVRGPLINSSVDLDTYTVYVRPFYDEVDNLGSLTLFTSPNTIYAINGAVSTGSTGLNQLSQSSAGSTVTAAYTTFEPTATPSATAGKFNVLYVIAGSTLEDIYTQGLEGDVVARSGNTLTLQGATLFLNDGVSTYNDANCTVIVGPSTLVTADGTVLTGLNYNSVAVGQHIIARGIYSLPNNVVTLDATGSSATNTGSVRLIQTNLYGSLVSSASGSLTMNLATIDNWPVSDYAFTGNGSTAATAPLAASFSVNSGAIAIPAVAAGDPLFVAGRFSPFGSAPPDFVATAVNNELSLQTAGTTATSPTPLSCGQANFDCSPATLRAYWAYPGTATPFSVLTGTGMTLDLSNTSLTSAVIHIGAESINVATLPASPQIIPTAPLAPVMTTVGGAGTEEVTLPPLFLPAYSYGNPLAVTPAGINIFSVFATFATNVPAAVTAAPALQFEARGTYNRATNTFNAISVNVVLD